MKRAVIASNLVTERDAFVPATIMGMVALLSFGMLGSNYPLFHTLVEMTVAAVAFVVFSIAWHTRRFASSDYLTFIGMACLPIGVVTVLHALAFKGLHLFGESSDLPTQLWIIARLLQAGAFFLAPFFLSKRQLTRPGVVLFAFTAVAAAAVALALLGHFPAAYVDGQGLTTFKIAMEFVVIAVTGLSALHVLMKSESLPKRVVGLLVVSMGATIVAELMFTLYADPFGPLNRIGHVAHVAAFALIYTALVETSLEEPLGMIFRDLKRRERVLSRAYETEHAIAETLQDAMEMATEEVEGLKVSHRYVAAPGKGRIGGDFYDVVKLADGRVAFGIGDVCGKGLDAAMTAIKARSVMRALAHSETDPAVVLKRMNAYLERELVSESFVTALFGTIDLSTGVVRAASAGHPAPVVCGRPLDVMTDDQMCPPLGILEFLHVPVWETKLAPGETLVLYTDGVLDAPGSSDRFGDDRLHRVLHAADCSISTEKLVKSVIRALRNHTGGSLGDDVAVVALRYEGLVRGEAEAG